MKTAARITRILSLLLICVITAGCNSQKPAQPEIQQVENLMPVGTPEKATTENPSSTGQQAIPWPTNAWQEATPESQGMEAQILAAMFEEIAARDYAIDSVSVVRNGYLVADAYKHPFQPDERHAIHSCTKSIVSALIGIAIADGYIDGIDTPILEIFSDRAVEHRDSNKEAMTLEHLLTMSTGLECRDSYLYRWTGLQEMRQSKDWVQHFLDLPMAEPPGERFEYCNGASFTLSAIIQHTSGISTLDYARDKLFGPLGIEDLEWPANPQGIYIGWGELKMRPLDMAKIGYLYLNEGRWESTQVVPADWVSVSTRKHIEGTLQDGYGYQWWIARPDLYMALGYAGQYIIVAPGQELVVVFTSHLEERDFYLPQQLLETYILPAIKSNTTIPEDQSSQNQLQNSIRRLAQP